MSKNDLYPALRKLSDCWRRWVIVIRLGNKEVNIIHSFIQAVGTEHFALGIVRDLGCPVWYLLATCDHSNLVKIKQNEGFSSSCVQAALPVLRSHTWVVAPVSVQTQAVSMIVGSCMDSAAPGCKGEVLRKALCPWNLAVLGKDQHVFHYSTW